MYCSACVLAFVGRLIRLEGQVENWEKLTLTELLLALGEEVNEENLMYIEKAREELI